MFLFENIENVKDISDIKFTKIILICGNLYLEFESSKSCCPSDCIKSKKLDEYINILIKLVFLYVSIYFHIEI